MAFLGPTDLKKFLNNDIISGYDEKRIKQAAYELSLGNEVYRTDAKDGKIEVLDAKNKMVEINPGQFTLLLTQEVINVPAEKLAFISIKAKHKLKGLVNVSGFHVDPGFNGQLLFSVYNAGPAPITLETGKPYFLIWFADLRTKAQKKDEYNGVENSHQHQHGINPEYIDALKRGELASPNVLLERIKQNENKLKNVFWAAGILISLTIAITLKIYVDFDNFKKGVDYGLKSKQTAEEIKLGVHKYLKDSLSLQVQGILSGSELKQQNGSTK